MCIHTQLLIRAMGLELISLLLPVSGCVMTCRDQGFSLTWKVTTPTLNEIFELCCGIGYKNQLTSRDSLCRSWILYVIRSCHGSSFQNVDTKRECMRSGNRSRCLRRSVETLSNQEGDAVTAKDHLELILARDVKGSRDFHWSMDSRRRKTRKMEGICWMGQRAWGQRTQKRRR